MLFSGCCLVHQPRGNDQMMTFQDLCVRRESTMASFLVSQNKTYRVEIPSEFLWSPQQSKNGSRNAGYELMAIVKKGDIIFHAYNQKIHAISVALTDSYKFPKPREYTSEWNNDGWRVDCKTHILKTAINYKEYLSKKDSNLFASNGSLKQQYLFELNVDQSKIMLHLIPENIINALIIGTSKNYKVPKLKPIKDSLKHDDGCKTREYESKAFFYDKSLTVIKDDIGYLGECAALEYLRATLDPDCKIIPVSSNLRNIDGNDAAGYDIKIELNDYITYVDVKTSTGTDRSFWMSANEVRFFRSIKNNNNESYEIFRIYGMPKSGEGTAYFEIFKEKDLIHAEYLPTSYKVDIQR